MGGLGDVGWEGSGPRGLGQAPGSLITEKPESSHTSSELREQESDSLDKRM